MSIFEKWKQGFQWRKFQDEIGNPPWEYYFLQNLPESEYPKYLAKLFYLNTGEKLPLVREVIDKKKLKTFNQKIQWLKLYGVTPLMRDCTDKVKVRDYVKEKIGEEYLKPVLQIIPNESHETVRCHCEQVNDNLGLARQSTDRSNDKPDCRADIKVSSSARLRFPKFQFRENWVLAEYNDGELEDVTTYFDEIDFEKLPNSFVIKTNHGCKWQYIIKNKEEYLKNKRLFNIVKKNITGWLEQDYCFWGGFEMQYRDIKPKILIEPLLRDEINTVPREIEVYCFNGKPKIFVNVRYGEKREICSYDENFNIIDLVFHNDEKNVIKQEKADCLIKQTFDLSAKLCTSTTRLAKDQMTTGVSRRNDSRTRKQFQENQLSKGFSFVRCDWLVFNNKLYFNELTFTPYSGLMRFNKKWNLKLGKLILINKEF